MPPTILLSRVLGLFLVIAGSTIFLRRQYFIPVFAGLVRERLTRTWVALAELLAALFLVVNQTPRAAPSPRGSAPPSRKPLPRSIRMACAWPMTSLQAPTMRTGWPRRVSSRATSSLIRDSSQRSRDGIPQVRPISQRGAAIACCTP